MRIHRLVVVSVIAVVASLALGDPARASYSLASSVAITGGTAIAPGTSVTLLGNPSSFTFTNGGQSLTSGGTTVYLGNENVAAPGFAVPSTNSFNFADVIVKTTTSSGPGDTFSVPYTVTVTATNNPPPGGSGTGSFTISGTLNLSGIFSNASGLNGTVNFTPGTITPSGTVPIDSTGVVITATSQLFAAPTVNFSTGNLSLTLTSAVVPEPSSVTLMGMGLVAGLGLFFRRRMLAARLA